MKKIVVSRYYRVFVVETAEEQVFSSLKEAIIWIEKLNDTFGRKMTCEVKECTERLLDL